MTAETDAPTPSGPTNAEIQAQRRAVAAAATRADTTRADTPRPRPSRREGAPSERRRSRANPVLAVVAVVLVLVAAGLGVFAVLTYQDAQDTRDASRPLEARAAKLRADVSTSDVAIDDLAALFFAIQEQSTATANAVTATNKAAAQYNSAEAGIADALGAEATAALDALAKATTTVKLAADDARAAVAKLPDGTHG